MKQKLRNKGWSEAEIEKAHKIMRDAERKKKSKLVKFLDASLYWIILLVMLLGNFAISVVLIPFIVVLNSIQLYMMIGFIALAFGMLFTLLIREMDSLTKTHYVVAGVFIPSVAIINVFIITNLANILIPFMQVNNQIQSPTLVGVIYGLCFVIPYAFYRAFAKFSAKIAGV